MHEETTAQTRPQTSLEISQTNLAENLFWKRDELMPSRKPYTHLNHLYHFKIPTWLVIPKTQFSKNKYKIIQSKDHNMNTKIS